MDKVELSAGTVSPAPHPRADAWGLPNVTPQIPQTS